LFNLFGQNNKNIGYMAILNNTRKGLLYGEWNDNGRL